MNPYLAFALAMCAIVLLSLAATAYVAVKLNRAAKRDLEAALSPLASILDGEMDLDEARVSGRYAGHLASGRVIRAPSGQGRAFRIDLVDSAGGESWSISRSRAKDDHLDRNNVDPRIVDAYAENIGKPAGPKSGDAAFRLAYVAEAGAVQLIRPMHTRRDIPSPDAFRDDLDALVALGLVNRAVQGAPDADWEGGRSPSSIRSVRGSQA